MNFFHRRRKYTDADFDAAEAMRPGWLRAVLMLGLFIAMGLIYSRHFDNRLAAIQAQSSFWDETKTWSDDEKLRLARRVMVFHEQWGMRVTAHVRTGPLQLPKINKTTVFIGMHPESGQSMVVLPDLASRLLRAENARLGHDVRAGLEAALSQCLAVTPSAQCLGQTLDSLDNLLNGH